MMLLNRIFGGPTERESVSPTYPEITMQYSEKHINAFIDFVTATSAFLLKDKTDDEEAIEIWDAATKRWENAFTEDEAELKSVLFDRARIAIQDINRTLSDTVPPFPRAENKD